jgi:hypothetical protein
MPRRRRHDVVTSLLAALVATLGLGAGACEADAGDAGCQLTLQVTLAGTPLTLLSNARIDQVGGSFVLLGSDGSNVRWAALAADGTLGPEQAFPLPNGVTSAYYAAAGLQSPGDTVLLAYLGTDAADPTGTTGELAVLALPADGSPPLSPATVVETFPDGVPAASSVVMSSSRAGMNAGLAWIDSGSNQVKFTTVSGAGVATGVGVATSTAGPPFSCLAFSPGKDDLTVEYYGGTTSLGVAGWIIAEANEGGSVDSTTVLAFQGQMGTCAVVTPTSSGYALVWQDIEGSWLAEYTSGQPLPAPYPFASASGFGGANLQPPQVGLAPFGTDFGVLFARPLDVELWRIGDTGDRRPGALIFPSVAGSFGSVSALPLGATMTPGGPLAVTYADYTSPAGVTPATGGRLFANAMCY